MYISQHTAYHPVGDLKMQIVTTEKGNMPKPIIAVSSVTRDFFGLTLSGQERQEEEGV